MAPARRPRPTSRAAAVAAPRALPRGGRALPSRRSVLAGLAVFAAAAGAFAVARETPLFAVDTLRVRGGTPEIRRAVERALAPELGASLLKVGGDTIDRRLVDVSWVASSSFDRSFPHTLVVTIRPERPVAVLRRGASSWLVSARGRVIEELKRGAAPGLPRIWLPATVTPPAVGSTLADDEGGRAARALSPLESVRFPWKVASVQSGEGELTLVLRSRIELRLGDPGDLRLKLAVARRVLPLLGSTGPGAYVDLSVPERPVASANPQVGGLG